MSLSLSGGKTFTWIERNSRLNCPICGTERVPVKRGNIKLHLGMWDQRKRKCKKCGCEFYTHEEITPGQVLRPDPMYSVERDGVGL